MRLLIAFLFLVFQAAGQTATAEPAKTVQVRAYVRKDGTVVRAYTRAAAQVPRHGAYSLSIRLQLRARGVERLLVIGPNSTSSLASIHPSVVLVVLLLIK